MCCQRKSAQYKAFRIDSFSKREVHLIKWNAEIDYERESFVNKYGLNFNEMKCEMLFFKPVGFKSFFLSWYI